MPNTIDMRAMCFAVQLNKIKSEPANIARLTFPNSIFYVNKLFFGRCVIYDTLETVSFKFLCLDALGGQAAAGYTASRVLRREER
jgi:hypothetical protein